ncbi:MAG TPA: nucleotidyltransferase family protein, partial [Fimbriimonas sp.]
MGGENKLLRRWGTSTVVGAVVRNLLGCLTDVLVVTGHQADEVRTAVHPAPTLFNPRYGEGLGTSIAAGVAARPGADGYLIALGDMPGLSVDVVRSMLSRFDEAGSNAIVAPIYLSDPARAGHPVLFGSAYRQELMQLTGDRG